MYFNNNNERKEPDGLQSGQQDAVDSTRDFTPAMEDWNADKPVGAQGGAQGGAQVSAQGDSQSGAAAGSHMASPGGIQSGRTEAAPSEGIPLQQRMFAFRGYYQQGARPYAPRGDNWSVPTYSQARETTANMYTPGIGAAQPYPQRRVPEPQPERTVRQKSGFAGRFIRAMCLIVLCVALSGLMTIALMEDWLGLDITRSTPSDNVTPVINQVVLGGSNAGNQRSEGLTTSVAANGIGMAAEDIYDMACRQVVGIRTEVMDTTNYFAPQTMTAVTGSGFIISSDGYILSNYHVIETAYKNELPLIVSLHDGTEFEAKVIGFESSNDIALIKIDATDLNATIIANSENVRVGQPVYTVGNPFGDLVYTMTEGIVSALDRVVTVDRKSISTFQFSAAVNSGNSGGPVYDSNGEVIGIVSAKIMGNSVEGIGFAIPINDAIDIASKLIEHGYISGRPLIGITVNTVTSAHAEYYGWVVGAYVRSTAKGSAAERSGLLVGDIITALGDDEVDSMETLLFTMRKYKAGDTTTLKVWRSGEELEISVTFDEDLSAGQPQRSQQEQQPQPDQGNRFVIPSP